MNLNSVKKVHMVGLGGIGVSALARLFLSQGKIVSGSDGQESEITDALKKEGVLFFLGHRGDNLPDDADLLVYSPAVPAGNPERQKADRLHIRQASYPEALGLLSRGKYTIAISGTDGKSTTTAISGLILSAAGVDPTVIVGSKVRDFHENLRLGKSNYLVVEACEYRESMLNLRPRAIVLTNITADHLDYYKNLDNVLAAFEKYVAFLPADGFLVVNADDANCRQVARAAQCPVLTYGLGSEAQLKAEGLRVENQRQIFNVVFNHNNLGQFSLRVPGVFNLYNALAAMRLAFEIGVFKEVVEKTLASFSGIWRRFEILGQTRKGALVISDYAHTPRAVDSTLKAAKEFYPGKKIVAVFQPHHRSRVKYLFDDFVVAFNCADVVILPEIYDVAGREEAEDGNVSSRDLAEAIKNKGNNKEIVFCEDLESCRQQIESCNNAGAVILFMGAGDIYRLAENFAGV